MNLRVWTIHINHCLKWSHPSIPTLQNIRFWCPVDQTKKEAEPPPETVKSEEKETTKNVQQTVSTKGPPEKRMRLQWVLDKREACETPLVNHYASLLWEALELYNSLSQPSYLCRMYLFFKKGCKDPDTFDIDIMYLL